MRLAATRCSCWSSKTAFVALTSAKLAANVPEKWPPRTRYVREKDCQKCGETFSYGGDKKGVPTTYSGDFCAECRKD